MRLSEIERQVRKQIGMRHFGQEPAHPEGWISKDCRTGHHQDCNAKRCTCGCGHGLELTFRAKSAMNSSCPRGGSTRQNTRPKHDTTQPSTENLQPTKKPQKTLRLRDS